MLESKTYRLSPKSSQFPLWCSPTPPSPRGTYWYGPPIDTRPTPLTLLPRPGRQWPPTPRPIHQHTPVSPSNPHPCQSPQTMPSPPHWINSRDLSLLPTSVLTHSSWRRLSLSPCQTPCSASLNPAADFFFSASPILSMWSVGEGPKPQLCINCRC